jgi:predicted ester cyclase
MSEANKQIARRWFEEVWNQQNPAVIDELFHPKGKAHGFGFPDPDSVLVGPEDFKKVHRAFCGAFPDLHITIEDVVAEDDRVAIRWSVSMTHQGDDLGFPATGKKGRLTGSSFIVIKDAQLVEGWNEMDIQNLFQNLKGYHA